MATVTLDSVNKVYDNGFQAIYDLSLDIDDSDAEIGARAVMRALRETLEPVLSIEQVMETLPPDLAQMMTG